MRAPILNFFMETVDLEQSDSNGERLGKKPTDVIVAGLLCTPMAYLPLSLITDANDKTTISSRTIAEIGDGGTPLGLFCNNSLSFGETVPTKKVILPMLFCNTKIIPWDTLVTAMNPSPEGITCAMGGAPWMFDGFKNGIAGMDFGIVGPCE